MQKIFNLTNLTLIVALSLSTVAAYYSIIGLTAIFAGAALPIIVMGGILELGKITTTVWLRKYWSKCGFLLKTYLVSAVIALAVLTSMGIFGFLSKAHMDTGIASGDSQAKLALYDEKIKTQRDNIELARKALQQMDAQVDQMLGRTDSERGAERAVQIRRQQANERAKLQKEIGDAQKEIARLNEERAPIAAESRKIEAEVGPIKYVAALIYGDNPDANLLERAVRWVIILLVIVFDPLAIALVLAANSSREWDRKVREEQDEERFPVYVADVGEKPTKDELKEIDEFVEQAAEEVIKDVPPIPEPVKEEKFDFSKHPYLFKKWVDHIPGEPRVGPLVYKPEPVVESTVETLPKVEEVVEEKTTELNQPVVEPVVQEVIETTVDTTEVKIVEPSEEKSQELITDATKENPVKILDNGEYVLLEGKHMRRAAAEELRPDLFKISADSSNNVSTNFGFNFPKFANKGDIFVRVDFLPNRVFKFDAKRWIEINKDMTQTYLNNNDYLQFLVSKIDSGEYDIDSLSEQEQEQIKAYLDSNK